MVINDLFKTTMKKIILCALALSGAINIFAQNDKESFAYFTEDPGEVYGVSDNGRYVAITFPDDQYAFLWDRENPNVFKDISEELGSSDLPSGQRVKGTEAYDVSDDGMVVGCVSFASGVSIPAYYKNGEWNGLEVPSDAINTNVAVNVTPDGKIITGYCCHYNADIDFGQYFPVQWILQDDGEYKLISYGDVKLPEQTGFIPLCTSADGSVIAGYVGAGMQSNLPVMLVNGKLKMFYDVTLKREPVTEYKGKWLCGNDPVTGAQIWTDDPNDPNILYYYIEVIDGYEDGEKALDGVFDFCDNNGNFYGRRTLISNLDESDPKKADLKTVACVYNINTGEWTDYSSHNIATCGVGKDLVFFNNNKMIADGIEDNVEYYYGFESKRESIGIAKCDMQGSVFGGVSREFVEAIGDYVYFPYVLVYGDFTGVAQTFGGTEKASVILSGNNVRVLNATDAAMYDLEGRLVATGTNVTLPSGTFVVKADDTTAKVYVK